MEGGKQLRNDTKYKKPRCDCGGILHGRLNEIWKVERYITKDGELGNTVKIQTSLDEQGYEIYLVCPKCGNIYESDYDNKDRLICGELKQ